MDEATLEGGGSGSKAYAEAISTYLGLAVGRLADVQNSLCAWENTKTQVRHLFTRQAIPMIWDFGENNAFGGAAGDFGISLRNLCKALDGAPCLGQDSVITNDAAQDAPFRDVTISSDPPYYDNVGYADLSDFFYVWLRPTLASIWPTLFRRISTPKTEELVATPGRHGGKSQADEFFMRGMVKAITNMRAAAVPDVPLAIYYAFKQAEDSSDGVSSKGWASFLQAALESGLTIGGTWPMRTELGNRMRGQESNALASSIVLVCRKRPATAAVATRADFLRALRREMPPAIDAIRRAGVGPVDMQQSIIGPGMGVFTRYARVLEDDDTSMPVRTALGLINRVWEEIENELDTAFDPETQAALAWFATYQFEARPSGELITLANAKNIPLGTLFSAGVFRDGRGKAGLIPREDLPAGWAPSTDTSPTVWECVQHAARVLRAPDGGAVAAAALVAGMGALADPARALAYRLFEIATNKGWAAEALVYNELAQEWPHLDAAAAALAAAAPRAPSQASLFEEAR